MSCRRAAFVLCLLGAVFAGALESRLYPRMIALQGGSYFMGQGERREITLRPFYLAETEVTQDLYQAVMRENPSRFKGGENPVDNVSWFDAVRFCNALSEQYNIPPAYVIDGENVSWNRDSKGFRLPTEAEWEYAARGGRFGAAGSQENRPLYAGSHTPGDVAWYASNAGRRTQPVRQKLPNELGLYDMSGNVWEWCWDWYNDLRPGVELDPAGPDTGTKRVYRGGSWFNQPQQVTTRSRMSEAPVLKAYSVGFRLAQNG